MMGVLLFIHVTACILLITLVLIQSGRGGGLVEGFSGVESMFGPKTNTFLTRVTTIFSIVFFVSCLSLAAFSFRNNLSIMKTVKPSKAAKQVPAAAKSANQNTATPIATAAATATTAQTAVATAAPTATVAAAEPVAQAAASAAAIPPAPASQKP